MKARFRIRIRLISAVLFLFASLLVTRLYFVQIINGDAYSERADRQYVRPDQNLYNRGTIFFEDKEGRLVSGATLKSGFIVALSPKDIENIDTTYNNLSNYIEFSEEAFLLRVGKKDDPYEEIGNRVDPLVAKQIDALNLPGVSIYKERWRFYPGGDLGAQMLGFVGFKGNELAGRYGLERYYEDVLSRSDKSIYVNFFAEIFANLNIFQNDRERSGDVITSIEPSVQLFLEAQLKGVQEKWNAKQTAGIIIHPKTGAIYALGVYPAFDVNVFEKVEDAAVFSNPIVESVYEMGSIIKPLTMAAGLDAGVVTAETTYYDGGSLDLDGYTISNFDGKGRGTVSMQEVLSQSLNTGVAFVVRQMGNDVFATYMKNYGIGEETGIDLPSESAGLISNLDSPRDLEYATAAFGQGIAMTPISTVRALSVLANGGVLMTPHVAQRIKYDSGISKTISFKEGEQVIKPETAEEITRMLVKVVDEALLGGTVSMTNYSIAAKTGTAQIASPEGGYYDDRFLHSFFGYFPAYEAEFLVFLYTLEPKEVRYASQTLTRPFMDIVSFLVNYYEVPPDR